MLRPFVALLSCCLLLSQSACSFLVSPMQPLSIEASDSRAEIYIDGKLAGVGAVTAMVQRDEAHSVLAKLGERTGSAAIGHRMSITGVLDIIGGLFLLLPLLGLLSPGSRTLSPDHVTIVLPGDAQPPLDVSPGK